MAQYSRRSFHVLTTTTVLAADRARGWYRLASSFRLAQEGLRVDIFGLAGVAWSGVEQLPDSRTYLKIV
jgi:hypothetical protein